MKTGDVFKEKQVFSFSKKFSQFQEKKGIPRYLLNATFYSEANVRAQ